MLSSVRWEGPGGWYGEVGREEGSGWGACDFFLKVIKRIKKKKKIFFGKKCLSCGPIAAFEDVLLNKAVHAC